jgi:hypothetical protein
MTEMGLKDWRPFKVAENRVAIEIGVIVRKTMR